MRTVIGNSRIKANRHQIGTSKINVEGEEAEAAIQLGQNPVWNPCPLCARFSTSRLGRVS